jgi:hypothetical protein
MATTTNYGWTTPNDTDLVKDGAAAIRTLGSSVDTTTKALNPSTTLGDIQYRSSTANTNTRLGIGTTGQVLTVASGVPSWATPAAGGGGKVLQVVQGSSSTSTTVSSGTYTATTLTQAITPTSATSKILILVSQSFDYYRNAADQGFGLRIMQNSTAIYTSGSTTANGYFSATGATAVEAAGFTTINYLDAPGTTSSITYSTQGRPHLTTNSGAITFQGGSGVSTITLLEIGA